MVSMSPAPQASEVAADPDIPRWQVGFAPDALPDTPSLTLGQRRVLQGCVQLFAEQGFSGSSVRDIAAASGLQPASLYNHFASKDAMLHTLMLIGHEHHADQILRAVLASSGAAEEQMRSLVSAHVRVHCEYSRLALVVNREEAFLAPDVRHQIAAIRDRSGKITSDIVERGARAGAFTPVGPQATMLALAGLGLDAARWFPYQSDISVDELASNYALLALRMLGVR
ncbi:MAG: TetR family transcriptional regulator [Frankiales bacterium]|nr:TetR family transcriptional regulator [Frankiales bacterium]